MDKDQKKEIAVVTLKVNLEPKDGNWDKMMESFQTEAKAEQEANEAKKKQVELPNITAYVQPGSTTS